MWAGFFPYLRLNVITPNSYIQARAYPGWLPGTDREHIYLASPLFSFSGVHTALQDRKVLAVEMT
jgi:hypothetical protein